MQDEGGSYNIGTQTSNTENTEETNDILYEMGGTDTVTDENEYDFIEPIKSRQRRTGRVLDQQFTMNEAVMPA